MANTLTLTAILSLAITAGCASRLQVWDASGHAVPGVPFRAGEIYVKIGERNRHSEHGSRCTPVPFVQTVALPTGSQYFVNVDPAQLAKTGLTVQFNDAGGLSELTLNTEPAGSDTIEALTGAVASLLPFAGVTTEQPSANAADPPGSAPACDAGETNVRFVRLQEYVASQAGS